MQTKHFVGCNGLCQWTASHFNGLDFVGTRPPHDVADSSIQHDLCPGMARKVLKHADFIGVDRCRHLLLPKRIAGDLVHPEALAQNVGNGWAYYLTLLSNCPTKIRVNRGKNMKIVFDLPSITILLKKMKKYCVSNRVEIVEITKSCWNCWNCQIVSNQWKNRASCIGNPRKQSKWQKSMHDNSNVTIIFILQNIRKIMFLTIRPKCQIISVGHGFDFQKRANEKLWVISEMVESMCFWSTFIDSWDWLHYWPLQFYSRPIYFHILGAAHIGILKWLPTG